MFYKKELLELPDSGNVEGEESFMTASLHPYHGGQLLRMRIRAKRYRDVVDLLVFCDGERYITYVMGEERWSHASLENLIGYWGLRDSEIFQEERDKELVRGFFGGSVGGWRALHDFQQAKLKKDLKNRNKRRQERIDRINSQLLPPPEDLERWVDETVFREPVYLYYKRRVKRIKAWCTHCRKEVELEQATHNGKGICPNCGRKATWKAEGKAKRIVEEGRFAFAQRVEEGILVRMFECHKRFMEHYREPELMQWEHARYLIMDGAIFQYEQKWHSKLRVLQWRQMEMREYLNHTFLYPWNLPEILGQTEWKYSGISEFAAAGGKSDIYELFCVTGENRSMEHVIKQGYIRLAEDIMEDIWRANGLRLREGYTKMRDILQLPKRMWMGIQKGMLTMRVVDGLRNMLSAGVDMEAGPETARVLQRSGHLQREIWKSLEKRGIPLKRLFLYLDDQRGTVGTYMDYLRMGDQMAYEWNRREVLWPEDLKRAHDDASIRLTVEQNRKRDEEIRKRAEQCGWMEWEMGDIFIRHVRGTAELVAESAELHHCVKSYANRVEKGETHIFFIRKREEPERPWYTLEWCQGRLVQCRTLRNESYERNAKVRRFVKEWLQYIADRNMRKGA